MLSTKSPSATVPKKPAAAARGKIDLSRIRRWWPDILRVTATYERIFESLHVLTVGDDKDYRRGIKAQTDSAYGSPI